MNPSISPIALTNVNNTNYQPTLYVGIGIGTLSLLVIVIAMIYIGNKRKNNSPPVQHNVSVTISPMISHINPLRMSNMHMPERINI